MSGCTTTVVVNVEIPNEMVCQVVGCSLNYMKHPRVRSFQKALVQYFFCIARFNCLSASEMRSTFCCEFEFSSKAETFAC